MNKRSTVLALAVAIGTAGAAYIPVDVGAQEIPPARVAILDIQKVFRESTVAVDIRNQVSRQEKVYQGELAAREQELRAASEELGRQRPILSSEAFAKQQNELKARVAAMQRDVETRKSELNQARITAFKQVERALVGIISEIAKERSVNLVLSRVNAQGVVLYSDKSLNITTEVVTRLDERLPSLKVPLALN